MILNLNWQIIWVFVNLLILFLLMKKFLFGPITKMLDDRAKSVADTLDQADERLADAEKQKAEYTQQLADARGEASRIIEEARKRADLAYSRRMNEAEKDIQRLNEQAARQREADREAMLKSAKQQIAADCRSGSADHRQGVSARHERRRRPRHARFLFERSG